MFKLATVYALVLTSALAVHGTSIAERACSATQYSGYKCETTGGSPFVDDCKQAMKQITYSQCNQGNGGGSHCATVAYHGSCKIDACGPHNKELHSGIKCGDYLQKLLDLCPPWEGRVGGYITPDDCNVLNGSGGYKLQFSHIQ